ncbi:glutathione S-transferase domain-containing protein [Gorgonomyces haynaldii]|nr:glutathione S-transferase domain-containing protein [Gorgonomyces haynaldii]
MTVADQYSLISLNLNYSSWSLRPRVLMDYYSIVYELEMHFMDVPQSLEEMRKRSPSGKAPALVINNGLIVTDSLAILETLAERHPWLPILPRHPTLRALCRSVSAEMHSSFPSLRTEMTCNLSVTPDMIDEPQWKPETLQDIKRIDQVWKECRQRIERAVHDGEFPRVDDHGFLFGLFSIADAMYFPVVTRFVTYYGIERLSDESRRYCQAILALPAVKRIYAEAHEEYKTHVVAHYELYKKQS